jgi:hypothetical protein
MLLLPSPTNHQRPNLLVEVQESEDQLVSTYNIKLVLRRHKRLEDDQYFHHLDRKEGIYLDGQTLVCQAICSPTTLIGCKA